MSQVFISYRREDDAHCARVRALGERLEAEGITVILDEFAGEREFHGGAPPRGWDFWSIQMATDAVSILAIGSEGWFRVINNPQPTDTGLGAASEAETIIHRLNRKSGYNDFVSIGVFDYQRDLEKLPPYLDKCARFDVTDPRRFATLLQWLNRPISGTPPVTVDELTATSVPFPGPFSPLDPSGFLDCREAFRAYEGLWSTDNRRRILLLEAEGEHGKSDLMTRFFAHSQNGLPSSSTAFLRLSPPVREPARHVDDLADALALLEPTPGTVYERSRNVLAKRLTLPTVIFVDGYEHAESEHALWLDMFLQRAIHQPLLRLIVAGRKVPPFRTQPWGIYAEHVPCDAFTDPDAFVQHALACGSPMPAVEILACCEFLRNQRDQRKQRGQPTDGLSPLSLISEINRRRIGAVPV